MVASVSSRISFCLFTFSAIVGKNGSGKSTLINLLVGALNQLSLQLKGKEIKTTAELERTGKELDQKVYCEIFYEIDNNFYCLKVEDILCSFINITQKKDAEFEPFFYTNIINYSLYAFNSDSQVESFINTFLTFSILFGSIYVTSTFISSIF